VLKPLAGRLLLGKLLYSSSLLNSIFPRATVARSGHSVCRAHSPALRLLVASLRRQAASQDLIRNTVLLSVCSDYGPLKTGVLRSLRSQPGFRKLHFPAHPMPCFFIGPATHAVIRNAAVMADIRCIMQSGSKDHAGIKILIFTVLLFSVMPFALLHNGSLSSIFAALFFRVLILGLCFIPPRPFYQGK